MGTNEEIGNYVDLDFGNGYTAVCGQLKEIPVVENEYVHRGDLLGYVAEPTKYYTVEGTNVFFEFLKDGVPVDALDFLECAGWITPVSVIPVPTNQSGYGCAGKRQCAAIK